MSDARLATGHVREMDTKQDSVAAPRNDFTKLLQLYIRMRFKCRGAFPEVGLIPGAWDILLDMALAQRLGQRFRIADAEAAAGAPPIAVLRALKALIDANMISRAELEDYATFYVQPTTLQKLEEALTTDYSN